MFEVGFTELLLIFALALVVLGPRRLPELATKVGRWVGKARAMARQLREQLDQEVTLEENETTRRRQPAAATAAAAAPDSSDLANSDLDMDSQGQPYYPADHHGAEHPASDAPAAEPTPSIMPPASAPEGEPSGESSQPQQAPDEQRERRSS